MIHYLSLDLLMTQVSVLLHLVYQQEENMDLLMMFSAHFILHILLDMELKYRL